MDASLAFDIFGVDGIIQFRCVQNGREAWMKAHVYVYTSCISAAEHDTIHWCDPLLFTNMNVCEQAQSIACGC
jgi:hypothetical protein